MNAVGRPSGRAGDDAPELDSTVDLVLTHVTVETNARRIAASPRLALLSAVASLCLATTACNHPEGHTASASAAKAQPTPSAAAPASAPAPAPSASAASAAFTPQKLDFQDTAMGTKVHFVAFTNPKADAEAAKAAVKAAFLEMGRLEKLMSAWQKDSEVSDINQHTGQFVKVSPETYDVIKKSLWAGKISEGTFDITFEAMSGVWKFGDAAVAHPKLPSKAKIERLKQLIDYRKIKVNDQDRSVMLPKGMSMSLGGIAKGYIVDKAAAVLEKHGVTDFLVQAGGDLLGRGHKPDGSPWVSGIRDPRGPQGTYFATIQLTDHAFSTAGDYARAYILNGKRYHHIIDPRTGYPATASRSVTLWAPDAFTADAVDDAVFILGPEKGLKLVDSIDGCGAVIVDKNNKVYVSKRLKDKVKVLRAPTDGI